MLFRYAYRGGVWIDLEQPTEDEVRLVAREFALDERIEKELFSPTPAPLVINGGASALVTLHFPTLGAENGETMNQEVDFVIGKHFILTAHYEVIEPVHHLKKLFETRDLVAEDEPLTQDVVLEILFAHLYASVRDHAHQVTHRMERIERSLFDERERAAVRAISQINREFLRLEAALAAQEEPLERFLQAHALHSILGTPFAPRAERILTDRSQLMRHIKTLRAIAAELRTTNSALLEARQNDIMKTLTIITVIALPLELIAFIFGMHAPGTPLLENPDAFWIIMTLMLGAIALVAIFFVRKRWIF